MTFSINPQHEPSRAKSDRTAVYIFIRITEIRSVFSKKTQSQSNFILKRQSSSSSELTQKLLRKAAVTKSQEHSRLDC